MNRAITNDPLPDLTFSPLPGELDRLDQIRGTLLALLEQSLQSDGGRGQDPYGTVVGELDRLMTTLAATKEKNRVIFHDSPDPMCLTRKGLIVEVNPAWLKLHGYEACDGIIGTDILSHIHPDDQHILQARRQSYPNLATTVCEIRDLRRDGTVVEVEVYSQVMEIGDTQNLLARIRDISAHKHQACAREALEAQLRETQKIAAMSTLTGTVAHDLNNLLGGIISYPDLMLFQLPEDSKLRGPLEEIINSGEKATAMVQDLMTLTRRKGAVRKATDLNTIVSSCLDSPEYRKLQQQHPQVEVTLKPDADPGTINGEMVALTKSVMALIANGAEAMPEGGRITITTARHDQDGPPGGNYHLKAGGHSRLTVQDEGPAIDPQDRERIFEPFYTKKVMGRDGTGLGMAVVRNTVETHCGLIEVGGHESRGNTFTLYFPLNHA